MTIRTTGSGSQGTNTGSGSNNNGNGGNGSGTGSLNVNIKTDTGAEINAGIDEQGRLYVNPTVAPNAQGGTGAEASVNDSKIIDTTP